MWRCAIFLVFIKLFIDLELTSGRPLTKKRYLEAPVEEDEGYGLSPLERSHLDSFLLGKEQSCFEDEWQILAREIDQTCCQLPQAPVDIQKPPVHSTKGIRSLVTPACQFCLKNGSLRSAAESHSLRDPVTKVLNLIMF